MILGWRQTLFVCFISLILGAGGMGAPKYRKAGYMGGQSMVHKAFAAQLEKLRQWLAEWLLRERFHKNIIDAALLPSAPNSQLHEGQGVGPLGFITKGHIRFYCILSYP